MGAGEFLQRLQPLKAEMEAAFFRVYQPFHVQDVYKRQMNTWPAATLNGWDRFTASWA